MATEPVVEKIQTAMQHHQTGRLDEAESLYRQVLESDPAQPQALHMLGVLSHQRGKSEEGVRLIEKALTFDPNAPVLHNNLGLVFLAQEEFQRARTCFESAIRIAPAYAEAHRNLGNVLVKQGEPLNAINCFRQCIAQAPQNAPAYDNLGAALDALKKYDEAAAAYRRAVELNPNFAQAWYNLGNALLASRRQFESIEPYRRALQIEPNMARAHNNLAQALKGLARMRESIDHYRKAVEARPDIASTFSNMVYALHFLPDYDIKALDEEHREWARRFERPLASELKTHNNDRSPERRLRIGYVSPDFRNHSMASTLVPMLEGHAHEGYEIFCYADIPQPDDVTRRLRAAADVWRETHKLSPSELAELIRSDQIDVLIDLTLHLAENRLLVFARKPAPVQVSFLGHPGSTGLSNIEYRITDHYLDPPGLNDEFYPEKCLRLPDCYWCYERIGPSPEVSALPALEKGYITFGCLNNFTKVSPLVIGYWASIIRSVPRSRLLVLVNEGDPVSRNTTDLFAENGFPIDRLDVVSRRAPVEYLKLYHRVDLGLDPYPYNGHSTTCDSLWMGVPVVSLAGRTAVSRGGLSILSNAGLPDWAKHTPEDYIAAAVEKSSDLASLAQLRGRLRQQFQCSPVMDGPRFARNLEALYRQVWREWCARSEQRA